MATKELIKKAAETARLKLSKEELAQFSKDAEDIIKLFSEIDKLDTSHTKPIYQPVELKNIFRADIVKKSLSQNEALANSPHKEEGFFKGPKTI